MTTLRRGVCPGCRMLRAVRKHKNVMVLHRDPKYLGENRPRYPQSVADLYCAGSGMPPKRVTTLTEDQLIKATVELKHELFRAELYQTAQAMDHVTKVIGFEVAEKVEKRRMNIKPVKTK